VEEVNSKHQVVVEELNNKHLLVVEKDNNKHLIVAALIRMIINVAQIKNKKYLFN
jgi:hypothetical protein